eukprot:COSAG05_NODE_851_length_6973_cov_6.213995_6_plen_205_part_00
MGRYLATWAYSLALAACTQAAAGNHGASGGIDSQHRPVDGIADYSTESLLAEHTNIYKSSEEKVRRIAEARGKLKGEGFYLPGGRKTDGAGLFKLSTHPPAVPALKLLQSPQFERPKTLDHKLGERRRSLASEEGYSWCENRRRCTDTGCLPCIIGISCVRCGSTALATYMRGHPQISWGVRKEHLWLQGQQHQATDWEDYGES